MANLPDFYHILNLEEKRLERLIPAADLKHAYRQALLLHHPDKKDPQVVSNTNTTTVDEITKAYRTLADATLRAEYDQLLDSQSQSTRGPDGVVQTRHTGIETVDLEDLDVDEDTGTWSRACRCGNQPAYEISEDELEKNAEYGELVTGCKGCSLWLKVLFSVAD